MAAVLCCMRNIEVSLDEETYRRVLAIATERNTSVSALVEQYLRNLVCQEFERLECLERSVRDRITDFTASDNLPRDEIYDRRR